MANEKRLIDANALQLEPDPWGGMNGVICLGRSGGKTMATVQAALKRMIDNATTVDAVEVVHAKWKNIRNWGNGECYGWCSNCETPVKADYATSLVQNNRFCHWCGAKMDGERKDMEDK